MRTLATLSLILLCASLAQAQELRLGILGHDIAPIWGNTKIEGGIDLNVEYYFSQSWLRPSLGAAVNSQGHTSRVYAGVACGHSIGAVFGDLHLGGALVSDYVRNLGSHVLIRTAGEIGYRWGKCSISILLDHISNAGLAEHNAGLDVLGVRWGWRF